MTATGIFAVEIDGMRARTCVRGMFVYRLYTFFGGVEDMCLLCSGKGVGGLGVRELSKRSSHRELWRITSALKSE